MFLNVDVSKGDNIKKSISGEIVSNAAVLIGVDVKGWLTEAWGW